MASKNTNKKNPVGRPGKAVYVVEKGWRYGSATECADAFEISLNTIIQSIKVNKAVRKIGGLHFSYQAPAKKASPRKANLIKKTSMVTSTEVINS